MSTVSLLLLFSLVICGLHARPNYRELIPNGLKVKCGSESWNGVGHLNPEGTGQLNAFGFDFVTNGLRWTRPICLFDSDGDGKTNGEELGDPDCEWQVGEEPSRTADITHPGNKDC